MVDSVIKMIYENELGKTDEKNIYILIAELEDRFDNKKRLENRLDGYLQLNPNPTQLLQLRYSKIVKNNSIREYNLNMCKYLSNPLYKFHDDIDSDDQIN